MKYQASSPLYRDTLPHIWETPNRDGEYEVSTWRYCVYYTNLLPEKITRMQCPEIRGVWEDKGLVKSSIVHIIVNSTITFAWSATPATKLYVGS